jgi:trigger factor
LDVKVIPAEKWKRYIEVTIPAEEVETEVTAALRRYQKKVQIHGFRKGKAPLQFVKQLYGGAVRQETIEEMVPKILDEAREKNALKTVGPVTMEDMKYDEKTGLNFRAAVEVAPEIELRQYKGLEFEKTIYDVEEQDVDEALEELREQHAIMRVIDGGEVQDGYIVVADLQKVDAAGFPIVGAKYENERLLVSGANEFTKPLIGAKAGEARRASFKERRPDGTMAEQPTHYQITIKEISEKILPPLDDTFAARVGKLKTLDELKKEIRALLERRAEQRSRDNLRHEMIDELIKVNTFELPEKMAETYAEKFFENVKAQFAGLSEEAIKNEARASAFRRLRWEFLREHLIAAERITVNDEDLRDHIVALALASKEEPQRRIHQTMNNAEKREKLRDDLLEARTLQFLESQMKIRERHAPYTDRGQQRIITV